VHVSGYGQALVDLVLSASAPVMPVSGVAITDPMQNPATGGCSPLETPLSLPLGRPVPQHRLIAKQTRTPGDDQRPRGNRVLHPVMRRNETGSGLHWVVDLDG
jgi:hypothetical protein